MRIEQLRALCEIVDQGFSISRAANEMNASQPAISKQIRQLELDVKVDLLLRRGGRIVGLTEPGKAVVPIARRMVRDAGNLRSIGDEFTHGESGRLVIATQHFPARYLLTDAIARFHRVHPKVQVAIRQGTQRQTLDMLQAAEADIGVLSRPRSGPVDVIQLLTAHPVRMALVTHVDHPALKTKKPLTLEKLTEFPMVTLDQAMSGGWNVIRTFESAGLSPNIAITAADMDVVKSFVARGVGISVLPQSCIDPERDPELRAIDVGHLFKALPHFIGIHRETFLRGYTYDLIQMIFPEWTRQRVIRHIQRREMSSGA